MQADMKLSMAISKGKKLFIITGQKLLFKFLRKLHLNWNLSVVKTFVSRNEFPHMKVARNTKKVGQAWGSLMVNTALYANHH